MKLHMIKDLTVEWTVKHEIDAVAYVAWLLRGHKIDHFLYAVAAISLYLAGLRGKFEID